MNWVEYLKIKNFKGVISRDEIPTKVKNIPGECFIINLDDTEGPGTHWVTAKENVGATNFAIGSVNAGRLEGPLAGDIAELTIFKQKDKLNNASTIKRIQKHLLDKYAITHEPMLSM